MKANILLAYLGVLILALLPHRGQAQTYVKVTYHYEPEILNQFTVMETGAGALGGSSPLAVEWYTHLHKGYMAYAYTPTSPKLAHRELFRQQTQKEIKYAARVDSDAVHRGKEEAKNIIAISFTLVKITKNNIWRYCISNFFQTDPWKKDPKNLLLPII